MTERDRFIKVDDLGAIRLTARVRESLGVKAGDYLDLTIIGRTLAMIKSNRTATISYLVDTVRLGDLGRLVLSEAVLGALELEEDDYLELEPRGSYLLATRGSNPIDKY